ncbi:IS3 family transposase, partial [Bacillus thuringiensis]|uniref:IS3 family transposase n=1 Tax=Bacillus thuringiensis TaxID=1428 RepID=UPI0026E3E4B4
MKAAPAYKKYEIIQEMSKGMRPIQLLCKIAEVSRSGYYKWLKRQSNPSPKEIEDEKIKNKIVECYNQVKGIYGYRRITVWLKMKHGIVVNHKRVQRLMNRMKLKAIIRKKRPYFVSKEAYVVSKNYLNRDFKAEQPNEKWVTD